MYLREAYLFALQNMNDDTWEDCCRHAINKMTKRGFSFVNNYRSVGNWNIQFRERYFFPHPNIRVELQREYSPRLLDSFSEAEFVINQWASANMKNLTIERLAQYIRSNQFIEDLHKQHVTEARENNLTFMSINQMRNILSVENFSLYAAWRFIKYLHFSYSDRRKTYYSDKHEAEENVSARKAFIPKYFENEKRVMLWVRLTNEEVEVLENDPVTPLLPDVGHRIGDTHKEFHIDCHPSFLPRERFLAARIKPDARELIILGQDESVYKQNSYSKKCWYDGSGATPLVPKSDGLSLMVSAYVSEKFGLGKRLSDAELEEVNNRRREGVFSHFESKESALQIYGETKKKPLTRKDCLIFFFEIGANNEGYWGYDQMALHNEAAFDVLSVCYPHCDFSLLADKSSGHTKRREDGLEVREMGKKWGERRQ